MSGLGMATAPLMAAGKKPGETPTDDEMYSYTFDPGRTGAERTPSATSAEREYFQSSYSPVRKIRASEYPVYAAQGGLMGLAEGGETAAPTAAEVAAPTASEAALAYLMGERSSSAPARSPLIDAQLMEGVRPVPMASRAPVVGSDNMYAFDPATGTFTRNPNYIDPTSGARNSGLIGGLLGGSGGDYQPVGPNPDFDTPEKQAAYYRENPTMGAITRAGQKALSYTPMSLFARAVAPEYMDRSAQEADAITRGTVIGIGGPIGRPDIQGTPLGDLAPGGGENGGLSEPSGGWSAADLGLAQGGLLGLAKGGMKSGGFVVPADVVSMIGEGNTDAGYSRIKSMIPGATAIKGKDGGQADTVKTSIEGKQPARVAHGEMYIPPETVKRMGGAKKLYAMMDRVREQATGSKKQIKPVSLKQAMA
jgi:hypothetical protein